MTLTRADIVDAMARVDTHTHTYLSDAERRDLLDLALDTVADELVAGNDVVLYGFGTFIPGTTPARVGRNPKRPEVEVPIPARRRIYFRPGGKLIEKMNPGRGNYAKSHAGQIITRNRRK